MPWCGPTIEAPFPSLGWGVADWLDDLFPGEPLIDEQVRKLVHFYRLDDRGRRHYRRGQLMGPKGIGKSPEAAKWSLAEHSGPTRFGGWDENGEPFGVPWDRPVVQIAAVSEDQAENTYGALLELLTEDDSRVAKLLNLDAGQTRVLRKGQPAARIDAVTASSGTREGQRVTFAVLDETHLWTPSTGGHALAAVIRRNAGKMGGTTVETTNAYNPSTESVAQATDDAAKANTKGVYQWKPVGPKVDSLLDRRAVKRTLKAVYDGAFWVDLDRQIEEMHDPDVTEADARRFYLNEIVKGFDAMWDPARWAVLADATKVVGRELVTLGFAGGRYHEATALIGCRVSDGHLFEVGVWENRDGSDGYEADAAGVDAAVEEAFSKYRVWRMYANPPQWQSEISAWAGTYGEKTVIEWWVNRVRPMTYAVQRLDEAIRSGDGFSHDGSTDLARHIGNCDRQITKVTDEHGRPMANIVKSEAARPIDAARAAVLAYEARCDAVAAAPKPRSGVVVGIK